MQKNLFHQPLRLQTPRLIVRRFADADVADAHAWCRDPEVSKFMTWAPHRTPADTQAFINDCQGLYASGAAAPWALEHREHRKVIGSCNFLNFDVSSRSAEIAYCLHPSYWRQGLASEAIAAVLAFGFSHGLHRVEASCEAANVASARVLARAGFLSEGRGIWSMKGAHTAKG